MAVYAPADRESRAGLEHLAAYPSAHCALPTHLHRARREPAEAAGVSGGGGYSA
jgi:hypothetical protein